MCLTEAEYERDVSDNNDVYAACDSWAAENSDHMLIMKIK